MSLVVATADSSSTPTERRPLPLYLPPGTLRRHSLWGKVLRLLAYHSFQVLFIKPAPNPEEARERWRCYINGSRSCQGGGAMFGCRSALLRGVRQI